MSNPFEDLRQAVVVRPMNSPGPQGAEAPEMKIQYSYNGISWHDNPTETDKYLRFSTDNGVSWSDAIYFNNLYETLSWVDKARRWATNPEDEAVEPGKYSALHYAAKAEDAAINAAAEASALIEPSIEKARQWAENPEGVPVEDSQYSALHHATRAARSELNAEAAALDAAGSAAEAFGAAAPAWDSETVYNYNDVVSFDNGHTYRCVGTNVVGEDHAPNFNGADNEAEWTRITVAPDGFFEVDENGDYMPKITPVISEIFMLDINGDIMPQEYIDLEPGMGIGVESQGKIEFVDSIEEFRASSFPSIIENVYVNGYYGAGAPGGGMFYRDPDSTEADNSGTIIVDANGVRWKRANVYEEYYASWFGVSTDIDDNSPLIQNALNVIPDGSTLIFGPGTFYCKQTIRIPEVILNDPESALKRITLQGSGRKGIDQGNSTLKYNGPPAPTGYIPFFDFRGMTQDKLCRCSIRNMSFSGPGRLSSIVCLWLSSCVASLFDSVYIEYFRYGIQIDGHYYRCKFVDVKCVYCNYGMRTLSMANGTAFYYCNFHGCDVGFGHSLNWYADAGIYFESCYFQGDDICIETTVGAILRVNQCYFESNGCIFDVYRTHSYNSSLILILENSFLNINYAGPVIIKQNIPSNLTLTLIVNNNAIANSDTVNYHDYFVEVESGDIIIKAENNIMSNPSLTFPICSKTPLKTSYFNNDFSDTN